MERRKFVRIVVDLGAHVAGDEAAEADVKGMCYSLGGGGFGLLLDRPFEVGSWVTIELDLGEERLNARGTVVRSESAGPGVWRVSTKLEELPDEDRKRLDATLEGA